MRNHTEAGKFSLPRIASDSLLLTQRSMLSDQISVRSQSRQGSAQRRLPLSDQNSVGSQSRQGTAQRRLSRGSSSSQGSLESCPPSAQELSIRARVVPAVESSGSCWSVRTVEPIDTGVTCTGTSFKPRRSSRSFAPSGRHCLDEKDEEVVSCARLDGPKLESSGSCWSVRTVERLDAGATGGSFHPMRSCKSFARSGLNWIDEKDEEVVSCARLDGQSLVSSGSWLLASHAGITGASGFNSDFEEYSADVSSSTHYTTLSPDEDEEEGEEACEEEEKADMEGERGGSDDQDEVGWNANQEEGQDENYGSWNSLGGESDEGLNPGMGSSPAELQAPASRFLERPARRRVPEDERPAWALKQRRDMIWAYC